MAFFFKSMKQARDYTVENGAQMEYVDGDYQEISKNNGFCGMCGELPPTENPFTHNCKGLQEYARSVKKKRD